VVAGNNLVHLVHRFKMFVAADRLKFMALMSSVVCEVFMGKNNFMC